MSTIWIDRSGIETYEKCPRKWYYQRAYAGTGLERADLQLAAEIGTAVHEGIEALLRGDNVEVAVERARDSLAAAYAADPLDPTMLTPQKLYDREEALALAEAIIRAWAIVRLARIKRFGEIVSIEKESVVKFPVGSETVALIARPDVVQRRTADGALFIRNLKTVSDPNQTWREQWKLDQQTLSECLAVEAVLGEKVSGVIIEGCIKGRRIDYPIGSGQYYHNSPLTQGWCQLGEPPLTEDKWQSRYEWTDEEGKTRRLGKGYRKRPVWTAFPGGVREWVNSLWASDAAVVEDQFIELPVILRSEYEIERWKRQVLVRAVHTHKDAELLRVLDLCKLDPPTEPGDPLTKEQTLDYKFPMHTASGNCLRPGKCAFYSLCHESVGDPLDAGYRPRKPHHEIPVEELTDGEV